MNIRIKKDIGQEYESFNMTGVSTIEDVARELQPGLSYRILFARVNGRDTELTAKVSEGDCIELLDGRTYCANQVYQRSLSMLYLKAIDLVYAGNEPKVVIDNSLNKGFYTIIEGVEPTEELAALIESQMRRLVAEDMPVIREVFTKEEGIKLWEESGYSEKADLLKNTADKINKAVFYNMDGYRNYFYGPMVPSAGYIEYFQVMPYGEGFLLRYPYYSNPSEIPTYVDEFKLFEAFAEERKWLGLLRANYLSDLNAIVRSGKYEDMILLTEALHEKRIAEIADMIKEQKKRIILIAGPSSSGKTTTCRRLCIQLRVNGLEPVYLGTDDYFVNREETPLDEKGEKDYESIKALDLKLFNEHMKALLKGEEVDIPEFDFIQGRKVFGKRITSIGKDQPIVIEGIHALNDELTSQIDDSEKFKIYISPLTQLNIDSHNRVPTTDARMLRRMVRDNRARGHSAANTIRDWPKVRAGEDKNVFPYNIKADVVLNSVLAYELCLLKKHVLPLLEEIDPDSQEYSEAVRIRKNLELFAEIDSDDCVPNNSIVREFIGGSVFVD